MMKKIVEIKKLKKVFGKKKVVLDNINLDIFEGEKIALMGANGAGKTTMLEILLKIIKPTEGIAKINLSPKEIGIQFQDANFPKGITTLDVIKFFNEIKDFEIDEKDLREQLKFFEIEDFINQETTGLSGGQNQKLNLILSIIHKPKLIILDEITTGLDISTKKKIVDYIDKISRSEKITLLIVSHNIDEVLKLSERIIYLKEGKVVLDKKLNFSESRQITEFEKLIQDLI